MKTLKYCSLCLCSLLMASCYEDEGNYTYADGIEDIQVKLKKVYGVKKSKEKMVYTITPEISTPDNDKSYLEYTWLRSTASENDVKADTIGTAEELKIEIDPNIQDFAYKHYIRLYVKDNRHDTETMRSTVLEIIKPYSYSWVVLHEQNNHAELGAVEYVGTDIYVTPDAYTKEHGESLTGKPLCMSVAQSKTYDYYWGYDVMSKLFVNTTNVKESGLYNQAEGFKLMADWSQLFFPTQYANIDFNNMELFASANSGLVAISNGRAYNNCYYSPFLFEMPSDPNLLHGYDLGIAVAGPHTAAVFDKKNHRFLHMALQSSGFWTGINQQEINDGAPIQNIAKKEANAIDPDHLDEDIEIIGSCNGYHYSQLNPAIWQKYTGYMYGLGSGNTSHVYVFHYYGLTNAKEPSIPYHFEFITPEGVKKGTPFASGYEYNNIIFYAVGNKVYKLDVSTGKSTMIYQHEESTATISCLKMAVDGYVAFEGNDDEGTESYGHPYTRTLGVGVNKADGTGDFVVLQLNSAGKVDVDKKHPSIQIHKGFGKIKDIDFM